MRCAAPNRSGPIGSAGLGVAAHFSRFSSDKSVMMTVPSLSMVMRWSRQTTLSPEPCCRLVVPTTTSSGRSGGGSVHPMSPCDPDNIQIPWADTAQYLPVSSKEPQVDQLPRGVRATKAKPSLLIRARWPLPVVFLSLTVQYAMLSSGLMPQAFTSLMMG